MRRKWKKITSTLLVCLLLLGLMGCGGTDSMEAPENAGASGASTETNSGAPATPVAGEATAKGRYMENQIPTPEGLTGYLMQQMPDGSLVLVDRTAGMKYSSTDNGVSWQKEQIDKLFSLANQGAEITSVALREDGALFISYIIWENSTDEELFPERYYLLPPDGAEQEMALGIDTFHTNLMDAVFAPDGRLFAAANNGDVLEIDFEKQNYETLFTLGSLGDLDMQILEDWLVVQDGSKVYFYSLTTGEIQASDEVLNSWLDAQTDKKYGTVMCASASEDGSLALVLAGSEGIFRHVMGGSVMEQLADGELTNLGDPSRTPVGIVEREDGSFLILYRDGELDSYIYDAEASAVPDQQLTVYALHDNETVRQAISVFRKEHPEVFVKFEVALGDESGMTERDAVNNLNTRLLAGEGPDLILLDGMPMDSYVEKGMLKDLSDFTAELTQKSTYFQGILEGFQREEGIFALPVRCVIPVLAGESEVISDITDLSSLADAAERLSALESTQETTLGSYTAEELLEKLFPLCYNAWIREDGSVDTAAVQSFLENAKRIYDAERKNLDNQEIADHTEHIQSLSSHYDERELAKLMVLDASHQIMTCMFKRQVLTAGYLYSMNGYEEFVACLKMWSGSSWSGWQGQLSQAFLPSGIAGISVNAAQPELAEDMLATLLGAEVQGRDLGDGYPVNADAFALYSTNPSPGVSMGVGGEDKNGLEVQVGVEWPSEEEIAELKAFLQTLQLPVAPDDSLKDDIFNVAAQVLSGGRTVEAGGEDITQKISLYLQE